MSETQVVVSIGAQQLRLTQGNDSRVFNVSTARRGPGQLCGSLGTPLGWHVVRARIGAGMPEGAVFVGRRPTGEVYTPALAERFPGRDWILTRILWLSGLERGVNRLGNVDSMRRFIYVHGTPDTEPMGSPASHGCVRMRNADIIELFDAVPIGTRVRIVAEAF